MLRTASLLALTLSLVSTSALAGNFADAIAQEEAKQAAPAPAKAAEPATPQAPAAPVTAQAPVTETTTPPSATPELSYDALLKAYISLNKDVFSEQQPMIEGYAQKFNCKAWYAGSNNEFEKPKLVAQAKSDIANLPDLTAPTYSMLTSESFGEYDQAKQMFPFKGHQPGKAIYKMSDPANRVMYAVQSCMPNNGVWPTTVQLVVDNAEIIDGIPMPVDQAQAFMASRANIPQWDQRVVSLKLNLHITKANKWGGFNQAQVNAMIDGAALVDRNGKVIYAYDAAYIAKRNAEIAAKQAEEEHERVTGPVDFTKENLADWKLALESNGKGKKEGELNFRDGTPLRPFSIPEGVSLSDASEDKSSGVKDPGKAIILNQGGTLEYNVDAGDGKKTTMRIMNVGDFVNKPLELKNEDAGKYKLYGAYKQIMIVRPIDMQSTPDGDTVNGFIEKLSIVPMYGEIKNNSIDFLPKTKPSDYKMGIGADSETNPNDDRDAGKFRILGLGANATPNDVIAMADNKFGQELKFNPETLMVRSPESKCAHRMDAKFNFFELVDGPCVEAQFVKTGKKWFGLGGAKYALTRLSVIRKVEMEKGTEFDKDINAEYGRPADKFMLGFEGVVVSYGESLGKDRTGMIQTGHPLRPYEAALFIQPIRKFVQIGETLTTKLYTPSHNGELDASSSGTKKSFFGN